MKPDWKGAPKWATHLALDYNGAYIWLRIRKVNGWGMTECVNSEYCYPESDKIIEERPSDR